jgi:uncharacterized protein CbrC (UPF0167 family)
LTPLTAAAARPPFPRCTTCLPRFRTRPFTSTSRRMTSSSCRCCCCCSSATIRGFMFSAESVAARFCPRPQADHDVAAPGPT